MLTQDELKKHIHYDPETGLVTRIYSKSPQLKNRIPFVVTSPVNANGYLEIGINNKYYTVHMLAWLYMTGEFPDKRLWRIDHKDQDTLNNRWSNLRKLTAGGNVRNQRQTGKPTLSGYTGVSFIKRKAEAGDKKHWSAHIRIDGVLKFLGYYETAEKAYEVRRKAHEEQMAIEADKEKIYDKDTRTGLPAQQPKDCF